jgi:hypothetical protein
MAKRVSTQNLSDAACGTRDTPRRFSLLRGFALFWLIYLLFGIAGALALYRTSTASLAVRIVQLATIPVTVILLWRLRRREYTRKRSYWLYFAVAAAVQSIFSTVCPVWW